MDIPTLKKYHRQLNKIPKPPKIKKPTRPYKYVSSELREIIYNMRMEGMKLEWLALEYGLPVSTVHKVIKRMKDAE
jgi:hypothetical protein